MASLDVQPIREDLPFGVRIRGLTRDQIAGELAGKVAFVTGAAGGMGRACALDPLPRTPAMKLTNLAIASGALLAVLAAEIERGKTVSDAQSYANRVVNEARGQATARRALIFGAGGAAALAGGVTLFVIGRGRERAFAIEGTAGGGGGGFRVRGRF